MAEPIIRFDCHQLTSVKKGSGDSGRNGNSIFFGVERAEERARNKNDALELVLIAAMRGGGDPNETIYQGRLYRRGACGLGDSGIGDAARSGQRHCHRRQ
jgi:hypothetical protein